MQRSDLAMQTQQSALCLGSRTIMLGGLGFERVPETLYQKEIDTVQAFVLPVTPCANGRHFLP